MSDELWATYSVKDHLNARALAADIMLFDRLVFPVPEKGQIRGRPDKPGPVEWTENPEEWKRWVQKGWDPDHQKELLELLRPVIRMVEWDSAAPDHLQYRSEAAKLAAHDLPDYAFHATRTVLTRDLPAYVTGVAGLGPAYRTVEEIERGLGINGPRAKRILPGGSLPTVLAWEFYAPDPDDDRLSPEELLRETVAFVTGDDEFRKRRTAFVEWQQRFLREGATDRESIDRAVEKMRALLSDAKKASDRLEVRTTARYVFGLAPTALGLGAALAGSPDGLKIAGATSFLLLGGIAVDEMLFKSAEEGKPPPTAFVHDARRHFGW